MDTMVIEMTEKTCDQQRVLSVLNLAHQIAHRYKAPKGLTHEDLVQAGLASLSSVDHRYDPSRAAYTTFAYPWIRQGISREIQHWSWKNWRTGKYEIEGRKQIRYPEQDEWGVTGYVEPSVSDEYELVAESVDLSILSEEEKFLIHQRYWLSQTLNSIGAILGLTNEAVRQRELVILEKLRQVNLDP